MADRELRKMKRAELIEVIYLLKQNEARLQEENEQLKQQLSVTKGVTAMCSGTGYCLSIYCSRKKSMK